MEYGLPPGPELPETEGVRDTRMKPRPVVIGAFLALPIQFLLFSKEAVAFGFFITLAFAAGLAVNE